MTWLGKKGKPKKDEIQFNAICENMKILQYASVVQLHSNFQTHGYIKRKLLKHLI